ncbi:MAG: hypothetical protein RR296_08975 [Clostridia bacterium]
MSIFESAKWIWSKDAASVNAYVDFIEEFTFEGGTECTLFISADAQYTFSLNGQFVGAGQYPDYPQYKVYDEYALDTHLIVGLNKLLITGYCPITNSMVYKQGVPGVIYTLMADGKPLVRSGEETLCAPNGQYCSGKVDMNTTQMGYTFYWDAGGKCDAYARAILVEGTSTLYPRPVSKQEIGPRHLATLLSQGVYFDYLAARSIGERMQYAPMAFRESEAMTGCKGRHYFPSEEGVRFTASGGDGIYVVLDLGQEDAGWLDIELSLSVSCEVLIGWGEHLDDLRVRTYVGGRNFTASYRGAMGRHRFIHRFRHLGLRYIQLFVPDQNFILHYAGILPTDYPVKNIALLSLPDKLHERIYDVSLRTLIKCLHAHYEDCPWREQGLYTMDSRNQMLCGYYAFGEYDLPKASLRLIGLSVRADNHLLEICAPCHFDCSLVSFSIGYLLLLQEYLLYSGDADFIREMLPMARALAETISGLIGDNDLMAAPKGDTYWNFYEWTPGLDGCTVFPEDDESFRYDAPLNFLTVLAFRRFSRMLDDLDEPDARAYAQIAARIANASHAEFWDEKKGIYYTYANTTRRWHCAELTQAWAICADICPEPMVSRVLAHLAADDLPPLMLSYSIYKYEALLRRPETYGKWVFDRIARDWGRMLFDGATTFWETAQGGWDFERAGSLCHGWSSLPVYFYFAYALGIRPTSPGFSDYVIDPVPSGLVNLRGRVTLRDGREISVS